MSVDPQELERLASQFSWYHSIDLGQGVVTQGSFGAYLEPVVMPLLDGVDLDGQRALDVGTADGKLAFEMERRGAAVVATDLPERPTVAFLQEHFESSVQYIPRVPIDSVADEIFARGHAAFDVVLCAGVLYHVYSPAHVLLSLRRLTRNGGVLLLETACTPERSVEMEFNSEGRFYDDIVTFWLPSIGCLHYLLRLCCFEPLDVRVSQVQPCGTFRYAVLARAVRPSEVSRPDPWLGALLRAAPDHVREFLLPLDLAALEAEIAVRPPVTVAVPSGGVGPTVVPRWRIWHSRYRRWRCRTLARKHFTLHPQTWFERGDDAVDSTTST